MPSQMTELAAFRRSDLVKIDGLCEPGHALIAAEAGADLLGLVFAQSKRQVTAEKAALIVSEVRHAFGDRSPLFVGVFVDCDAATMNGLASAAGLDVIQLHGSENAAVIRDVILPVIRAIGPAPESTVDSVMALLEEQRVSREVPALYLIDAYDPVRHGGTGKRADWALASGVAGRARLMLAGGLTADNVAEAINHVRPVGVDVSSGVETDGIKDPAKVREFVAMAKRAFADREADRRIGG